MKRLYSLVLGVVFLLFTGCASPPATPTVPPISTMPPLTPTPLPDEGLHFLLTSSGIEAVQIKRLAQGWTAFHPASWGTTIQRGDLIQPPSDGDVVVLCADLTVHTLTQEAGSPCQVSQPDLFWDGVQIVRPMAPGQQVPFIIYPRRTGIIETHPLLQWHDTGASSYTVAIIQDGVAIWQEAGVTTTEIHYPDDAPPLEPGENYLLEITDVDSGASSSADPSKGLGFQLLAPEKTAVVNAARDKIMALPLDEGAKQFALANYYAGQGLYGDALAALDEVAVMHESPQMLLWRGRVLIAIRFNADAQTAFNDASILAETLGDVESQAEAQAELWELTGDEGHWDTAVALYQQLGDTERVSDLENEP